VFDTWKEPVLNFILVQSHGGRTTGGIFPMKKVLITYHSQGGNTEAMAKAVFKSANAAGAEVILQRAADADAQHILACDIVAIGTPDHFGYMAGLVKDRFDLVRATSEIRWETTLT
jgi:flavodoxin